jgi:hypothetical protein
MKPALILALAGLLLVVTGCADEQSASSQTRITQASPAKVLRHVVLFKFKDEATAAQVQSVVDAFSALPGKINVIKGYEWGTDVSPEKRAQGFTHIFFLTFTSEADRDAYLVHPDHKAFGAVLGPHLDKVLVVDYWARR